MYYKLQLINIKTVQLWSLTSIYLTFHWINVLADIYLYKKILALYRYYCTDCWSMYITETYDFLPYIILISCCDVSRHAGSFNSHHSNYFVTEYFGKHFFTSIFVRVKVLTNYPFLHLSFIHSFSVTCQA